MRVKIIIPDRYNDKTKKFNYKHGLLKWFILGSVNEKFRYIYERLDKLGRYDFRRKTLLKCLK